MTSFWNRLLCIEERPEPDVLPAAPDGTTITDFEDDRIPEPARVKIRRILACVDEVLAEVARGRAPDFSTVDVEQMRDIHLVKLIASYVDIPEAYRADIFRRTGRSASFMLVEGLDRMQGRMDEILRNLAQRDIDAFTTNLRFIGTRYRGEDPFS